MIIGLSGLAGVGKDTVADILCTEEFGFTKIALADPMKRFCREVFGFTQSQLWGPSAERNKPDPIIPYLTPRQALQTLGTEWGRACYEDIWIAYALTMAQFVRQGKAYYPEVGIGPNLTDPARGVVFTDIRFKNELLAIRKGGGEVWRIVRSGAGLAGEAAQHASEVGIEDADCDLIIQNDSSMFELWGAIRTALKGMAK